MPAAAKAARPGSPPGAGSTARTASTASPTTTTLLRVPRPGRSRSGIQASSTSAPTTIVTDPSDHPSRRDSPWWRTSHGITPSEDRTISAIDTPYRTSPAYSCASRRGSLQLVKQLVEEALLAAFLRALAVAAVVVAVLERVGDGLLPATLVVAVAGGRLAALPAVLGVDQALELAPVEEDAAAVGALVDGDAAALVGPHEPLALRADQLGAKVDRLLVSSLGSARDHREPRGGPEQPGGRRLPEQLGPLDVAQPLQPGRAPAGRLDQLDHLVGVGPAGQRQLLGDRRVVVVVVVAGLPAELAEPLPGLAAQGLDRVGPAPQALEQHQPPLGGGPAPGGERGTRVGQRPQQVPLDHGVERAGRRLLGAPLDHLDLEAVAVGVLAQALQHPAGQVEGGHPVAEPGRGQ